MMAFCDGDDESVLKDLGIQNFDHPEEVVQVLVDYIHKLEQEVKEWMNNSYVETYSDREELYR
jgi:hypothetical protein